jgi:hypothetical protein
MRWSALSFLMLPRDVILVLYNYYGIGGCNAAGMMMNFPDAE